jgi:hypothetical protein
MDLHQSFLMKLAHSYTRAKLSINQFMAAANFPPRSAPLNIQQLSKHTLNIKSFKNPILLRVMKRKKPSLILIADNSRSLTLATNNVINIMFMKHNFHTAREGAKEVN